MSEPEIARRCSSCGASVRSRAMFCPQCGDPIPPPQTLETDASETIIEHDARPAPEAAPTQALHTVPIVHKPEEHSVRSRVKHIRKVSSVMIDQAAYDPSLRFLLVAAGLFIVFIVLLILSKVIG
jgi:zinc-ribbon domain